MHYKVCFKGFRLLLSSEVSDAGLLEDNQWSDITPRKINIEPGNDGLVQMIFLFQGAHILRFQPLIFQGLLLCFDNAGTSTWFFFDSFVSCWGVWIVSEIRVPPE